MGAEASCRNGRSSAGKRNCAAFDRLCRARRAAAKILQTNSDGYAGALAKTWVSGRAVADKSKPRTRRGLLA